MKMNQLKEITMKNIQKSKNISEIETLIDKEWMKLSENKTYKTADSKFVKELQYDLLKIEAINVSSSEWANIKKARLYLNSLKIQNDNL